MVRIAVHHDSRDALELFAREISPAGTSWSPGTTGGGGGRPPVQPLIVPCSFSVGRDAVAPVVRIGEDSLAVPMQATAAPLTARPALPEPAAASVATHSVSVPLVRLAWGRSGD